MLRALTSHQCDTDSSPGVNATSGHGLSFLLVLSFAPKGFSPITSVFPFPNSNSTSNQVDGGPLSGCATSILLFFFYLGSSYSIVGPYF